MLSEKNYTYQLSVIIVNYNVAFFLEQCLNSVVKASKNLAIEVYMVDNNSIDESVEMVQSKFPMVKVIANKENVGFSKANNQAIRISDAKYVLLLNPDTLVEEDTFAKTIEFMDEHPEAGGLGVRMIDGKGVFLPESKRGLPTPSVAFYKIFGLSKLFPKSKKFGQYHLGHLSEFETHEIDILSGAFMMMRSSALDQVGLLDEAFFMYGEDIDLSYRIQLGGYKNFYFPKTQIIHYKGESTKKSSVNYVFVFYKAMVIFAQKHFSQKNAKLFSFFIHLAIYLRASLAIGSRILKQIFLPLIDLTILYFGLYALTEQWERANIAFPEAIINHLIPVYLTVWTLGLLVVGAFKNPISWKKLFIGILLGTFVILAFYALLPKNFQFSRLFILLGASWISLYFLISRIYLHFAIGKRFTLNKIRQKRYAIIGSEHEFSRISNILTQSQPFIESIEYIALNKNTHLSHLGDVSQLDQIVFIHKINELIFCAKDFTSSEIINFMSKLELPDVDFKIAQPDTDFLIGSNSIDTAGDLYVMQINAITKKENQVNKRIFDVSAALTLCIVSPILLLKIKNKPQLYRNLFAVIKNQKSLIGFHQVKNNHGLPLIKKGILNPMDLLPFYDEQIIDKMNIIYARDYNLLKDFKILLKGFSKLDRK